MCWYLASFVVVVVVLETSEATWVLFEFLEKWLQVRDVFLILPNLLKSIQGCLNEVSLMLLLGVLDRCFSDATSFLVVQKVQALNFMIIYKEKALH
jgi:hypothetical protein